MQVAVPVLISVLLISKLVPNISNAFGFIMIAGSCGGHGTAAAVGAALAKLGFQNAMDLCHHSGYYGRRVWRNDPIKIATRKNYTSFIKDFRYISGDLPTGLIPKEKQESLGKGGVSVVSINPFAWYLALLMLPAGLAILGARWLTATFNLSVPDYCLGFLFSVFAVTRCLDRL